MKKQPIEWVGLVVVVQGNNKRNNIHKSSFNALNSKNEFYNLVEHYV